MTPNKIPGMRLKGIGRKPQDKHIRKEARSYLIYKAKQLKDALEQRRRELANRPFLYM